MLSAISYKIYEMRRYLVLSLVISLVSIPIGDVLVIERDRNRSEMYGEAFWLYGFAVYNMTDNEVALLWGNESHFTDGDHVLPEYLGNITYEYPVFGMIFYAIAVLLYPGSDNLQHLWLNFLLVLVFLLNLVMIAILLGDKVRKVLWARLFFGAYFVYGLIMSAGGGKLEPLAECLFLMALILRQEGQKNKSMFTLGLAVQTKIYPGVAFPILFIESPISSIWFFASMLLTVLPFIFQGLNLDSLLEHFLNTESYSSQIVNTMYPGLAWDTPSGTPGVGYAWPPALIPLVIYIGFMLVTTKQFIPLRKEFMEASWHEKILLLKPLYVYLLPAILFLFRWVMPWYLFWLGIAVLLHDSDRHAIAQLKAITIVGLVYTLGIICNWPYFSSAPLIDFTGHFKTGWFTLVGIGGLILSAGVFYIIWKWEFERRERKAQLVHEAEARGELVI